MPHSQASAQDTALLDRSIEPPLINTNPGPEYADAVRPGNMVIGTDRTPKSRLWAAWVGNGDLQSGCCQSRVAIQPEAADWRAVERN